MEVPLLKVEPCTECPYPTVFVVNMLDRKLGKEKYSVHCRKCNDKWIEEGI